MNAQRRGIGFARSVFFAAAAAAIVQGCGGDGATLDAPGPGARDRGSPGVQDRAIDAPGLGARETVAPVSMDATTAPARPVDADVVAAQVAGRPRFVVGYSDASTLRGDAASGTPPVAMAFAYSDDGQRWNRGEVTGFDRMWVPVAATLGSPALASRPGTSDVYYAALAVRPGYAADASRLVVVSHSRDGGATFPPPMIATMPQFGVTWRTADEPSLTVDGAGAVHLVFVADRGTPDAQIEHWIGDRDVPGCVATCMTWQRATPPAIDPRDAPYVHHPVLRAYHLGAFYLAYEVREPRAELGLASLRVVLRRYDAEADAWTATDAQPGDGATYAIRVNRATGDEGARMDLAVDPVVGTALVVWSGAPASSAPEAVFAQRFRFVTVYNESWERPIVVSSSATTAGTTMLHPTASLAGAVRAVTWSEHDAAAARVRVMAVRSDDDGATFASARNLTQLVDGASDASMPVCPSSADAWAGSSTSITTPDENGTPLTLTLHAGARDIGCDATTPPGLEATVWGLASR